MLRERQDLRQKLTFKDRLNMVKIALSGTTKARRGITQELKRFSPVFGEPPKKNTEEWIELYNKSPRMNPIHLVSSDIATTSYNIYTGKDNPTILKDNLLQQLLNNPCPNTTINSYVLMYITQVYLMLPSGEAFWLKERNGFNAPTQLWPIPPHWVIEIPTESSPYYVIAPSGNVRSEMIKVPDIDMVYFKKPNVTNPYLRGIGRAECIGDEIETDEYMAKHQKRFFFNDATPKIIGQVPGIDQIEVDRLSEIWQQKYGGVENKHKFAWLNWEAKFEVIKQNFDEMDFIESRRYLRDSANQHYMIPPELFGILENSNRSTIDAAYYLYTKNVLSKELKFIQDVINTQLAIDFKNVYLQFDNIVPDDKDFILKRSNEGLKNGALYIDEWRIDNGYEPLPNGEGQKLIEINPVEIIPDDIVNDGIKSKKKIKNIDKKDELWQLINDEMIIEERKFINFTKKFFQKQQDYISKNISNTTNVDELIDWEDESKALFEGFKPLWLKCMAKGFDIAMDIYNDEKSIKLINTAMKSKFMDWIDKYGFIRATMINDTTVKTLQSTIAEGLFNKENVLKLRDRISKVYENIKHFRTDIIARTETHCTINYGIYKTFESLGVEKKEWITKRDANVRDIHIPMYGEIVNFEDKFSNGLMYPGDPLGSGENTINCRCIMLPVI